MSYIFAHHQLFTEPEKEKDDEEEGGEEEKEEDESNPFRDFFIKFLINLQDCIDFELTLRVIMQNQA